MSPRPLAQCFRWCALAASVLLALAPTPVRALNLTPAISVQPTGPANPVAVGSKFALTVRAEGLALRYQWQLNGINIPGATATTLEFPSFQSTQGGAYNVVVANKFGSVRSQTVRLQPNVAALPFTDAFDTRRLPIGGFPNALTGNSGSGRGSNSKATVERAAGEPLHAGSAGGASLWLSWTPSVTGIATIDTAGSDFDTVVAVYVARNSDAPGVGSLVEVASNDNPDDLLRTGRVRFDARAGTRYFIAVDGALASLKSDILKRDLVPRGGVVLAWRVQATLLSLPKLTSTLLSKSVNELQPLQLSAPVEVSANATTTWQWWLNGKPLAGKTGINLDLASITRNDVGTYFCDITSTLGIDTATTRTKAVDIQIARRSNGADAHVLAQDRFADAAATSFGPPGLIAARPGAMLQGLALGASGTQIFNTSDASADEGEPQHCGVGGGKSEWYAILATASGYLVADTLGSDFDTVLAAYTDTGLGTGLFDGLVPAPGGCANDSPGLGVLSRIVVPCTAGTVYYLAIDGVEGAGGIAQLNYSLQPQLTIRQQPAPVTVGPGQPVTMRVSAEGVGNLRFVWKRNGAVVAGATTDTLVVPAQDVANNIQYVCEVTDEVTTVVSQPATITLLAAPGILQGPTGGQFDQGASVSLSVNAVGSPPLAYQWRFNGSPIPGQTAPSLTLAPLQPQQAGTYTVVISNPAGATESLPAQITVVTPPVINQPPSPATVNEGQSITLSILATSLVPITYQWRFNGVPIAGQTGPSLTLGSVTPGNAGAYSVVVSNSAGSVESAGAMLTVAPVPILAQTPVPVSAPEGGTATFGVTASSPTPVTYQWKFNGVPLAGQTLAVLTLAPVTTAHAGNYSVVVSNGAGSVESAAVALTVLTLPVITQQPAPVSIEELGSATFRVDVASATEVTYQWNREGSPLPGRTAPTLVLEQVLAEQSGRYSVDVSNAAGTLRSAEVLLTVSTLPKILAEPADVTTGERQTARFSVSASSRTPLTYEWRRNGQPVEGGTGPELVLSGLQPGADGVYSVRVSNGTGTVESRGALLTVIALPVIQTPPAGLALREGQTGTLFVVAQGPPPLSYQWRLNGVPLSGRTSAAIQLSSIQPADAGSYTVVVSNPAGSIESGAAAVTVTPNLALTIRRQPVSRRVASGGSVTFNVEAVGSGPLTYQWSVDGRPLLNANAPSLVIPEVWLVHAGRYTVTVREGGVGTTSDAALLQVVPGDPAYHEIEVLGGEIFIFAEGTPGAPYLLEESEDLVEWTGVRRLRDSAGILEHRERVLPGRFAKAFRFRAL